ncbi:multidrug resistance-associated protein 1 [Striga asiatica]|uniref:Multidrug resistance-associated protein 1 n=1 Tax=Striga asiatica TaxID=4170 RepID=A0A5A7Q8Z4_STRAF|nr:multidrug resistance-associated protein 1 [Striga asiatica]
MGNCINKCKVRPQTEVIKLHHDQEETKSDTDQNGRMVRIKIVLTKEELELLMLHLENRKGKKVEDVLDEIQRSREKRHVVWKPSLDRITECHELDEEIDR